MACVYFYLFKILKQWCLINLLHNSVAILCIQVTCITVYVRLLYNVYKLCGFMDKALPAYVKVAGIVYVPCHLYLEKKSGRLLSGGRGVYLVHGNFPFLLYYLVHILAIPSHFLVLLVSVLHLFS